MWMMTINGASLSTDFAQRIIKICLADPVYDPDWQEKVFGFIQGNRNEILADVVAFLHGPVQAIESPSRWAVFDREIIGRLDDPNAIMAEIHSRRAECDVEGEEAEMIHETFATKLEGLGYDPECDSIFIPSKIAAGLLKEVNEEQRTVTAASRALKQLYEEGRLPELMPARRPGGKRDRGFLLDWQECT